jgi:hypothetical protein
VYVLDGSIPRSSPTVTAFSQLASNVENELFRFHNLGQGHVLQVAQVFQRLHATVGGHEDLDQDTRKLTADALRTGFDGFLDKALEDLADQVEDDHRRQLLTLSDGIWIAIFSIVILLFVVFAIANIVTEGADLDPIPFFTSNSYFAGEGSIAEDYEKILPCNVLPLRRANIGGEPPKFQYLPIVGGLITDLTDKVTGVFRRRRLLRQRDLQGIGSSIRNAVEQGIDLVKQLPNLSWWVDEGKLPSNSTCVAEGDPCYFVGDCCPAVANPVVNGQIKNCSGFFRNGATHGDGATTGFDESASTAGSCQLEDKARRLEAETNGKERKLDVDAGESAVVEPFCLAWSKDPSEPTKFDTFGFAPLQGWPPVAIDPFVVWFLPWCCKYACVGLCLSILVHTFSRFAKNCTQP